MSSFNRSRTSSNVTIDDHLRAPVGAIKKVPGEVAPVGRFDHEVKAFEKEIRAKSLVELQELLERQLKILENSTLVRKLPDKGEKVKKRKEMIKVIKLVDSRVHN